MIGGRHGPDDSDRCTDSDVLETELDARRPPYIP